jgi:hypothetical protein
MFAEIFPSNPTIPFISFSVVCLTDSYRDMELFLELDSDFSPDNT